VLVFANNYSTHVLVFADRLLYPPHITGKLTDVLVGNTCPLQLERRRRHLNRQR